MPQLILVAILSLLLTACSNGPPVAGTMTKKDLCRAVESAIRKQLDVFVISEGQECQAKAEPSGSVEIASGFKSPLGTFHPFVARGQVDEDSLAVAEIQVDGLTEGFVAFGDLKF